MANRVRPPKPCPKCGTPLESPAGPRCAVCGHAPRRRPRGELTATNRPGAVLLGVRAKLAGGKVRFKFALAPAEARELAAALVELADEAEG